MSTVEVPKMKCPTCGKINDLATCIEDNRGDGGKPQQGDMSLCFSCGELFVFTPELTLRKSTQEERELASRQLSIASAQAAIRNPSATKRTH